MLKEAKESKAPKYALLAALVALAVTLMLPLVADDAKAKDEKGVSYGKLSVEITPKSGDEARKVLSVEADGQNIFCLPSGADESTISYGFDKSAVKYEILNGSVASVFYESDDPASKGRAYVDGSREHTLSSSGYFYLYDNKFQLKHRGKVKKFRGRGNSTWNTIK